MTFCDLEPLIRVVEVFQCLSFRFPPIVIKVWFRYTSEAAFFLEKEIISSSRSPLLSSLQASACVPGERAGGAETRGSSPASLRLAASPLLPAQPSASLLLPPRALPMTLVGWLRRSGSLSGLFPGPTSVKPVPPGCSACPVVCRCGSVLADPLFLQTDVSWSSTRSKRFTFRVCTTPRYW